MAEVEAEVALLAKGKASQGGGATRGGLRWRDTTRTVLVPAPPTADQDTHDVTAADCISKYGGVCGMVWTARDLTIKILPGPWRRVA
jgi:hypothetical protein